MFQFKAGFIPVNWPFKSRFDRADAWIYAYFAYRRDSDNGFLLLKCGSNSTDNDRFLESTLQRLGSGVAVVQWIQKRTKLVLIYQD
ncbi:hypothetical protein IAE30_18965 [Pantoea sp. S61]|uniref:hypothetical protein n=1 Tax=Pantoea sp. S61 TaxID=2767442 RepID=UPI00190E1B2E|nr:hypothetical protein [Pantoea sp. S61]MBK0125825.1 hypothetical protein [Pantoea sp. S61]